MAERLKISGIVVAAGSGSRMNSTEKKQFMELSGMPLFLHSVKAFEVNPAIDNITVVTADEDMERVLRLLIEHRISKVKNLAPGGKMRFESVYHGLCTLPADTDIVLIHDGARPLISQEVIRNCIKGAFQHKACAAAVKAKNTIKRADAGGFAAETLERAFLYEIQTPQAFSYKVISQAYFNLNRTIKEYNTDISWVTDDAVIVENMTDVRVKLVEGDYRNIKITTPEDMIIAEALLNAQKSGA